MRRGRRREGHPRGSLAPAAGGGMEGGGRGRDGAAPPEDGAPGDSRGAPRRRGGWRGVGPPAEPVPGFAGRSPPVDNFCRGVSTLLVVVLCWSCVKALI